MVKRKRALQLSSTIIDYHAPFDRGFRASKEIELHDKFKQYSTPPCFTKVGDHKCTVNLPEVYLIWPLGDEFEFD